MINHHKSITIIHAFLFTECLRFHKTISDKAIKLKTKLRLSLF